MDYYYPMEEEVHQLHPGLRPAQLPWQWQLQWRLFSLMSSPAALQPPQPRRPAMSAGRRPPPRTSSPPASLACGRRRSGWRWRTRGTSSSAPSW